MGFDRRSGGDRQIKKYLDENDTIGWIRLERRHPRETKTVWVLLEGDSDQKIYRKLIDGDDTEVRQVYHSNGSGLTALQNVVRELREVDQNERVIGIRDADFLHLNNETEITPCLFVTDYHDIETMMISNDKTFRSVVAEHVSDRLSDYQGFRKDIFQSIRFIGGIRWYNENNACGYNFNGLGLGKYYDGEALSLDQNKCIDDINLRSPGRTKNIEVDIVNNELSKTDDTLNLCNGHDFTKAFRLCSGKSGRKVSDKGVEAALRLAYDSPEF